MTTKRCFFCKAPAVAWQTTNYSWPIDAPTPQELINIMGDNVIQAWAVCDDHRNPKA